MNRLDFGSVTASALILFKTRLFRYKELLRYKAYIQLSRPSDGSIGKLLLSVVTMALIQVSQSHFFEDEVCSMEWNVFITKP